MKNLELKCFLMNLCIFLQQDKKNGFTKNLVGKERKREEAEEEGAQNMIISNNNDAAVPPKSTKHSWAKSI